MKLKSREIFEPAPKPGTLIWASAHYTRGHGVAMMRWRSIESKSDLFDTMDHGFSEDNGRTWSPWMPVDFLSKTKLGTFRRWVTIRAPDPYTGRLLLVLLEGTLPTDDPLEGMKQYHLAYRVSEDGGHTFTVNEKIVQKGDYSPEHPAEGVWVGRNALMSGYCALFSPGGRILIPVTITPMGPNGVWHSPGGGFTYEDTAVMIGQWQKDGRIEWQRSQLIQADPKRTTRGLDEPALARMPDGRVLIVMRGSNAGKPELPGYKWYSISNDDGFTWQTPQPWGYDDDTLFFSPSALSVLITHSNGKYYWIGNICQKNSNGNEPRYPLVIGEVDPKSLMLKKNSVFTVDDRGPDEHPGLQLSNYAAHEDRENGDIVIYMSRWDVSRWHGDASIYRLEP